MKYQSEINHEILEQRGHEKSSLHYQSECIETWIAETKGAYPKLTDYESEWLNYISILDDTGGSEKPEPPVEPDPEPDPDPEPPIGEFPYETLIDVAEATVDNVVPLAYKSAILKGKTIVNRVASQGFGGNARLYESRFEEQPFNPDDIFTIFVVNPNVATVTIGYNHAVTGQWTREERHDVPSNKKITVTVPSSLICKYIGVTVPNAHNSTGFENSLVAVKGDQSHLNVDSYFDGMLSVRMPVLRTSELITSNNNEAETLLFNQTPFNKWDWTSLSFVEAFNGRIKVKFKETVSSTLRFIIFRTEENTLVENPFTNEELKNGIDVYFTEVKHIGFHSANDGIQYGRGIDIVKEMIDNGDIEFKLYEDGHKANIITVNEDVTLRSNEDIYDEINLLTGQLTQRIGENNEVLSQEVVKTVDLSITDESGNKINHFKPFEGTMHIQTDGTPIKPTVSMEIPVEAITQNLASFIGEE